MIQAYYGNGKGKTTAAIGSAVRCAGCGNKVLFVQFLKNNDSSEFRVLAEIDRVDILYSQERYALYDNMNGDRAAALSEAYGKFLFEEVKIKSSSYQMIILDEVLDAVRYGYIDETEFLKLICGIKENTEIILTGHCLSEKIADVSDYISEIREICHPYTKGTLPRRGIEF